MLLERRRKSEIKKHIRRGGIRKIMGHEMDYRNNEKRNEWRIKAEYKRQTYSIL